MESDTPRTDAESPHLWVVPAEFAKQLERELAAAIKERDEARRWFCFEARRASDGKNSETYAKQIADMFFWDCFAKEGGGA